MVLRTANIRVEVGVIPKKRSPGVVYFSSFEEMNVVLNTQRIALLEAIRKHNPESIYALAKILERDQGNVTKDVNILEEYGFVQITRTRDGGRMKSEPRTDVEAIEMIIKLGAGAYGIAKDSIDELSSEFKGEKLKDNADFAKKELKRIVKPIKKTLKNAVKRIRDIDEED